MQPFDAKLDYRGRQWCTVRFELGHTEIGDANEPELDDKEELLAVAGMLIPLKGEIIDKTYDSYPASESPEFSIQSNKRVS
ncbi:hypothetical protein [Arthrobacter antibioticus]|uniref:hypothetical protein n=1 Tax=Arthrobacter sp. H35-MC1 TaxID=3046203 RepID=UPI0024BB3CA3|nr:hypothetical protein [Arthrobacter sp. H35-MC1]MDJ0317631.1 hypothetical protein [Arthrobacter sp. H35-MC1]